MTTTATNPYPNIAPPGGAETLCDWADWDDEFRFVFSETRVEGTNFVLSPCAAQLPDGSIDTECTHCKPESARHQYEVHFAGPRSLVISHDHTTFGAVATSSGFTVGGWVACRRRSRTSPALRSRR